MQTTPVHLIQWLDMVILVIIAIFLLAVIILFSFPRFSPIPYYPSNMQDKQLILKALRLEDGETLIDLGAGDGVVVFEAAYEAYRKKLNTRFVALELNPILILILYLRRWFHPNRKNIRIVWGDMFKINYDEVADGAVTFYLYISPWLIEQAISHALSYHKSARFVSYYYPIKSMKHAEKEVKGVHSVFSYDPKL